MANSCSCCIFINSLFAASLGFDMFADFVVFFLAIVLTMTIVLIFVNFIMLYIKKFWIFWNLLQFVLTACQLSLTLITCILST